MSAPLDTVHLESQVQALLVKRVRLLGGKAVKLAPTEAGVPDMLVMLPGGSIHLVEVKADAGELSPIQVAWHARVAQIGVHVEVLRGRAGVLKWLADHTERRYRRATGARS